MRSERGATQAGARCTATVTGSQRLQQQQQQQAEPKQHILILFHGTPRMPHLHELPIAQQRALAERYGSGIGPFFDGRWPPPVLTALKLDRGEADGRVVWELQVSDRMVDGSGTLQSGWIATIVDVVTFNTMGVLDLAQDALPPRGVSLGPLDHAAIPKRGQSVVFTTARIYVKGAGGAGAAGNALVAESSHSIFIKKWTRL
ncbi:hypothetical protein DFJ73DRAFT_792504 [Zopfochytrium polystomum]|nr:hypothetical protein DFJ73DRAFT_792504 [Zopfochytrium polystomum]